jgi:hypothetical protein
VHVRPQHEQRQHEVHAPRRVTAVASEQPEHEHEQRHRRGLRADLERPRRGEHAHDREQRSAGHRPAEAPRRDDAEHERRRQPRDVGEHRQAQPARAEQAVEDALREPLLVDPLCAARPDVQRVRGGQPLADDLAARDEREPAVLHELLRDRNEGDDREEAEARDRDPLVLEQPEGAARAAAEAGETRHLSLAHRLSRGSP